MNKGNPSPVTIRRILVAVDGSEFSDRAGSLGINLAAACSAHLTIFSVAKYPANSLGVSSTNTVSVGTPLADPLVEKFKQKVSAQMERLTGLAKKSGISASEEIVDSPSSVVSIISDYAYQNSIDLILVGSRGLTAFESTLVGSVSEGLVQRAPCAVLVVR
jgi:nucleotide-binding universal stress UspA family protein